jgi:hypothetical protein
MKILEALKVHRAEDGAHVVTHHHNSHPPETHRFASRNQAVGHILSNMQRLSPQGDSQIEEQEESRPDPWMGGRPASFDYGSARTGEMQGRRK